MQRTGIARLALAIALGASLGGAWAAAKPGQAAPAADGFRLDNGEPLSLTALRGRWVLVDFWASWCGPCKLSLPALEAMRRELHAEGYAERFEVLAVNLDAEPGRAQRFLEKRPVSYPVLSSPDGKIAESWALPAMPTSYLVSPEGEVHYLHSGYRSGDDAVLRQHIVQALEGTE